MNRLMSGRKTRRAPAAKRSWRASRFCESISVVGRLAGGGGAVAIVMAAVLAASPALAKNSLHKVDGIGSGTGTSTCVAKNCTSTVTGTASANLIGSAGFSATLNFSTANPLANGSGGSCFVASGTATITAEAKKGATPNTLSLAEVGLLCNVGAGAQPTTFDGTFVVTSGTGRLTSITGSGDLFFSSDASGNVLLDFSAVASIPSTAKR